MPRLFVNPVQRTVLVSVIMVALLSPLLCNVFGKYVYLGTGSGKMVSRYWGLGLSEGWLAYWTAQGTGSVIGDAPDAKIFQVAPGLQFATMPDGGMGNSFVFDCDPKLGNLGVRFPYLLLVLSFAIPMGLWASGAWRRAALIKQSLASAAPDDS